MKALGIVSAPYRGFIRKLSELRNEAVHNVQHTNLNLNNLVSDGPASKRSALAEALGAGVRGTAQDRLKLLEENPKGVIWVTALCLMSLFAVHKVSFESSNKLSALSEEALRLVEGLGA
jgi:hypothetical protein